MKSSIFKFVVPAVATVAALSASAASSTDEGAPGGFAIGQHMTLRPYLSFSYTYDSNVDSSKHSKSGSQWVVSPRLVLEYRSENWKVDTEAWYQYHAYNRYVNQLNSSSYGEKVELDWVNSAANEKGWKLHIAERYEQIAQDDDATEHGGRGIGRDRQQLNVDGAIERRLNESIHATAVGGYYMLDYDNNVRKYAPLYGWKRTRAGGEIGWAPSPWTDFIIAADYQWYQQDNSRDRNKELEEAYGRRVSSDSKGWTVQAGIATRATERLSYRLLAGWSWFEYGGNASSYDGFTYTVSGNWKIGENGTWNLSMLGSSYYQPSETSYGNATKVSTISVGLRKSLVRGALNATLDLAYRNEDHDGSAYSSMDYDIDYWTIRGGLNYRLNRFCYLYGNLEYQNATSNGGNSRSHYYDYDRVRGTIGIKLTY